MGNIALLSTVKRCWKCKEIKSVSDFYDNISRCKSCTKKSSQLASKRKRVRSYTDKVAHAQIIVREIKQRAKLKKVPFNLTIEDIQIPDCCPALGIKLEKTRQPQDNSITVDRIKPELGYVKGNVLIVSNLANDIKNKATWRQIELVAQFYKELDNNG